MPTRSTSFKSGCDGSAEHCSNTCLKNGAEPPVSWIPSPKGPQVQLCHASTTFRKPIGAFVLLAIDELAHFGPRCSTARCVQAEETGRAVLAF